jgi:hypothetical protein
MAREICQLADVTQLVPGYSTDAQTDALLNALITAESRTAHDLAGREFVVIAGATTRRYDLTGWNVITRRVRVGDMTTVTTVKLIAADQATELETVAAADRVSLPRVREEWQPIRQLWFPPASATPAQIACGRLLEITGTWGFPAIPADLEMAVAKMVLVRYINDAANAGTALADAVNEIGFDAASAFASARDVIRSYSDAPFA